MPHETRSENKKKPKNNDNPSFSYIIFTALFYSILFLILVLCFKYRHGIIYQLQCTDLPKEVPAAVIEKHLLPRPSNGGKAPTQRTVRLVFVRHAQSYWNVLDLTNFTSIKNQMKAEIEHLFSPYQSPLFDAPLTNEGLKQVEAMRVGVAKEIPLNFLNNGEGATSKRTKVVVSNMRRALETALTMYFGTRYLTSETKTMLIDSSLQEGCCHIDSLSYLYPTKADGVDDAKKGMALPNDYKLRFSTEEGPLSGRQLNRLFDTTYNRGDKFLAHANPKDDQTNVFMRHDEFVKNAIQGYPDVKVEEVPDKFVVVGHSSWFRRFFLRFLPETSSHIATTNKIKNTGAISFDLVYTDSTGEVRILESSIKEEYLGFMATPSSSKYVRVKEGAGKSRLGSKRGEINNDDSENSFVDYWKAKIWG